MSNSPKGSDKPGRGPDFHFYIDDSGQREYARPGQSYSLRLSRYFVFGGTLLRVAEARRLSAEIIALKLAAFGTADVEVKSSWLRRRETREEKYLVPYMISDAALDRFVEDFYDAAGAADLLFVASVVDKMLMTQRYQEPWHTPAAAYEALVQRLQNELGDGQTVAVYIDRLSGSTRAGNQYEVNLREHHRRLGAHGSRPISMRIGCLHSLPKFVDSSRSQIIQVSDLIAYNVLRQVRDHGHRWEKSVAKDEMYPWFRRVLPKFRRSWRGKIQGYGVVPFPKP